MTDPTITRLDAGPGYQYTYYLNVESWYWPAIKNIDHRPQLMVGKSADGGGTAWEFAITEEKLDNRRPITVRLFDEAFPAFNEMHSFFGLLALRQPTTIDQVRGILDELGVVDATERTDPNA
ncbi:hypothetical protein [Micromonospora carbonacea]|uniref:Uncharacterized protein n=1 Tax=Micromonospora carbonacea TaxID=47853 RepID=A0A1C5AAY5_9ACTN|nr:hypothetical protein [Micromonospora carbonacea]SCF42398.1 hypothetical protein GA0070563_11274 [Micromonospora carbonacea]